MLHGFLNIDKPGGITSHDVVARIRRVAGQRRIGHGGTLDPLATGVLPIALGVATRLVDYLVEDRKAYRADVLLGITTTTDDAEGTVVAECSVPPLDVAALEHALLPFVGTIQQVPPIYSAIQVGGQRMYDVARRGETVELAPRTVEIDRIDVVAWQPPHLTIDVVCGKGTYIRALARDLGTTLGCGAHLAALQRTAVGPLRIDAAVSLDDLINDPAQLHVHLLPPAAAVAGLPRIDIDSEGAQRIRHGLPLTHTLRGEVARVHDEHGTLLALARRTDDRWHPFKVFDWT
jgi:tRNA pseudouridine55 synthase